MIRNLFIAAAAACVPAFAVTPVTSCGQILSTPGETYVLTADVTCTAVTYVLTADVTCTAAQPVGLRVVANDIVIDLQGFTLTGNGTGTGILTAAMAGCVVAERLEVRNGTIQGFGTGIGLCVPGANPVSTQSNIHNLAIRNSQAGVYLGNSSDNQVKNVTFDQINVAQAPANPLITYRIGSAIYLDNSNNNKLQGNTITASAANGIGIDHRSSDNEVRNNTITGSGASGIVIKVGAHDNLVRGNKATGSTSSDLADDNVNCGTNDWLKNTFGTASQACIH